MELLQFAELVGVNDRSFKFYVASKVRSRCTFYDLFNIANIKASKSTAQCFHFNGHTLGFLSTDPNKLLLL